MKFFFTVSVFWKNISKKNSKMLLGSIDITS
jgi:hypothetical protein